jgi:hypothetical protein
LLSNSLHTSKRKTVNQNTLSIRANGDLCAGSRSRKPLCIDLYAGLGGWSEGFIAEGFNCIGFDNHRHEYGNQRYPGQLVIQDVLTLHGSQFRNAACIVASPPCQNYSYLAMPWSRSSDPNNSKAAKALRRKWETEGPDNRLFDACFRIQREAILARQRQWSCWCAEGESCPKCFIPLIVENVRGAIPWVGRSAWNYGSFHLWGDVPALMPINLKRGQKVPGFRFDGSGGSFQTASVEHTKNDGGSWFNVAHNTTSGVGKNPVHELTKSSKESGGWFNDYKGEHCVGISRTGSKSAARKAASAQIAKIPLPLSSHIARVYYPREVRP